MLAHSFESNIAINLVIVMSSEPHSLQAGHEHVHGEYYACIIRWRMFRVHGEEVKAEYRALCGSWPLR